MAKLGLLFSVAAPSYSAWKHVTSAALTEVCVLMSSILVIFIISDHADAYKTVKSEENTANTQADIRKLGIITTQKPET